MAPVRLSRTGASHLQAAHQRRSPRWHLRFLPITPIAAFAVFVRNSRTLPPVRAATGAVRNRCHPFAAVPSTHCNSLFRDSVDCNSHIRCRDYWTLALYKRGRSGTQVDGTFVLAAPSCLRHLCACVLELNLDEAVEGVKCAIHRCDSPPQRRRSLR